MPFVESRIRGWSVRDHRLAVPVDRDHPERFGSIEVFAREVVDADRAHEDLPVLLFLQGGPGGTSPRPTASGWWTTALSTHRLVLLDQRGTGRSSRIDAARVAGLGGAAADYLACFRADAIVADAEDLRREVFGGKRWATLGQSYGGFVTLSYLSRHPEALTACYVTGGLPGLRADAEEVYRRTVPRQLARNAELGERFPADVALLGAMADRLAAEDVRLPDGDRLTVERWQTLGMGLGMSTGVESMHWLLDAMADGPHAVPDALLGEVAARTGFAENPLYAVLQEVIYHQGERAGGWAAAAEHERHGALAPAARPLVLTGEAMFPWMFSQVRALRPFQAVAEELAARQEWPLLYDLDRLAANEVPVAAVQYVDDPYVDLELALGTADAVGNARVWVTNEYLHDGLRVAGEEILPRLIDLAAGRWSVTHR